MDLFPVLLATHIVLAVALFIPSVLLPFVLRARSGATGLQRPFPRILVWLQTNGTLGIGAGLALTGVALLAILGPSLVAQPWLLLALVLYGANLCVAFFVQRPDLRRLLGIRADGFDERERWKRRARRQRYLSYLMAAGVGLIAFLMSTKPRLW